MARLIVLDSGPLWLLALPYDDHRGNVCRRWLTALENAGATMVVPEITLYEARRELLRRDAIAGLRRLETVRATSFFLPITSAALHRAAELWAIVRKAGRPTAAPGALDADAILAAQATLAAGLGDDMTIATGDVGDLKRFPGLDVRAWATIK
jgi:predicted nucleic acid-binding protein